MIAKEYFEFREVHLNCCDSLFFRDIEKSWYLNNDLWSDCVQKILNIKDRYDRVILVGISAGAAISYVISRYLSSVLNLKVYCFCFAPILPTSEILSAKYTDLIDSYLPEHRNTFVFINTYCLGENAFLNLCTENVINVIRMPYKKHGLIGGSAIDLILLIRNFIKNNELYFLYNLRITGLVISPLEAVSFAAKKLFSKIFRRTFTQ